MTTVSPGVGLLALTGLAPTVVFIPAAGALVLSGPAPALKQVLPLSAGVMTFAGLEPDLDPGTERPPGGTLVFAGAAPVLLIGALEVPTGTVTLAGLAPALSAASEVIPPVGTLSFAGHVPVLPATDAAPGVGALVLSGAAPVIGRPSAPAAGPLVLSGLVPTIDSTGFFLPAGTLVLTGHAPEVVAPFLPGVGALVLVGHAPGTGPGTARLVLQGLAPSLVAPIITVPAGNLTLQGFIDPPFVSGTQTTTTTLFAVRRVREFPFVTEEQIWLFFHRLQIYLEMGVGLDGGATVQGDDPQIMLQWSDTNGRTWSTERWVSAGKAGEFKRRALWRRLGRSRKRMFRVTITDPVRIRLIDAYLDITKGLS